MKESEGVLPNPKWLDTHIGFGLTLAIKKHPELFAHLKQDRLQAAGRTDQQQFKVAKDLQRTHGFIPCYAWLRDHRLGGFAQWLTKNIAMYPFLKWESKRTHGDQHLVQARVLQKKHGKIPGCAWLINHGMRPLACWLITHRNEYPNLKQLNKYGTTDGEYLKQARALQKKHGQIPYGKWLIDNRMSGLGRWLYSNIHKHPDLKWEKRRGGGANRIDWLAEARALQRKHGKIPHSKWLQKNRHSSLDKWLRKNKHKHPSLKQDCKVTSYNDYLDEARALQKEHGKIPNPSWLIEQNKYGLMKWLETNLHKHPRLKQLRLRTNGQPV